MYQHPAPKKSNVGKIVVGSLLGVLLICGGGAAACGALGAATVNEAAKSVEAERTSKLSDVKITKCGSSDLPGFFDVEVVVTNSSDKPRSYWIQVDLMSKDGTQRYGESHVVINDLAAGAKATETTSGTANKTRGGKCVLNEVN